MKSIICHALLLLSALAAAAPQDLSFRRVWTHRGAFEGELPFPSGVSFLPIAQYQTTVTNLPTGLSILRGDSPLMSFAAPTNVAPPYVMRLSITGNSLPAAKKWRLLVSEFAEKDIRASLLESDDWKGPFSRVAGPVPENATGTTLVTIDGTRYGLAGSSKGFFRVFSYPGLERLGTLRLSS